MLFQVVFQKILETTKKNYLPNNQTSFSVSKKSKVNWNI